MAHTVELEGDSYNVVTNVHELCKESGEERGQSYVWTSQNFFSFSLSHVLGFLHPTHWKAQRVSVSPWQHGVT